MDQFLILEFNTYVEAATCLGAINNLAAQWWPSQGYTVIDGELVGKKQGVDNKEAAHTKSWDNVYNSKDGTYWFASPSNNPAFANWKLALASQGFTATGTEKEFPDEWNED